MYKFDCFSTDDINQISPNVVASWQKIICRGSHSAVIDADKEDGQFKSNSLGHHNAAIEFLELLMDKIETSEELLTKVKYNRLSENLEVIIL